MLAEYMTSSVLFAVSKHIRRIKSSFYSSSHMCVHICITHIYTYTIYMLYMCTYNTYTHTMYEQNPLCYLRRQSSLFWNLLTEVNPQGPISWLFYSVSWLKRRGLFTYFGLNLKSELKDFCKKNKSTLLYRTKTEAENGCAIYIYRKITGSSSAHLPRLEFTPDSIQPRAITVSGSSS